MVPSIVLWVSTLVMHPFHVSVAEAHWNEDATRLQVALRLTPRDLDAALSSVTGRRVVLENTSDEEAERLVREYVRDRMYLSATAEAAKDRGAETIAARHKRFHWVGLQQELRYTWVYFELERPGTGERVWLTNQVICEVEPTQINTLQLLRIDPPVAVRTTAQEPTQPLPVVRKAG